VPPAELMAAMAKVSRALARRDHVAAFVLLCEVTGDVTVAMAALVLLVDVQ